MSHCNALVVTAHTLREAVADRALHKYTAHLLALLYVRLVCAVCLLRW
jgi:hypothetical protein